MSTVMENVKDLMLEDETFEQPRQNFNRVLQRLFKSMIDSGSTEGSITLKMDVSMVNEYIPNYDPEIEGESRKIQKPSFKHKVSSTVTVKDEITGNQKPEMELVWDEELQRYVLAYICNTDQRTIFDPDMAWNQRPDPESASSVINGPVSDGQLLPGPSPDDDMYFAGDGYGYEDPEY